MSRAGASIEVSIIIVSHNTCALTVQCLDSLRSELSAGTCEIIVVDTASGDGSQKAIARHPLAPRLIALASNVGFGRANNIAAGTARGRYLLLLNPDTLVRAGAVARLIDFARSHPAAGIWGGRTLFADGRLNLSSCWRRMTPWNQLCRAAGLTGLFPASPLLNAEAYGGWHRDSVREVDIVSGCFLLITRELWNRLGGFDPVFLMYGEDADLCLRARKLGARPMVTPEATIVHYGGASEACQAGKLEKLLAAKATLIDRHWPVLTRPVGRALLALWPASRALALTLLERVSTDPQVAASALTWREVWARRARWVRGYPAPLAGEMAVRGLAKAA